MGFFDKLKDGLKKTRDNITHRIDQILVSMGKIDEDMFEELEEVLITSDVGVDTTLRIIEDLKARVKKEKITDATEVKGLLKEEIAALLGSDKAMLKLGTKPSVIVVIGVNGVGKTTTIRSIAGFRSITLRSRSSTRMPSAVFCTMVSSLSRSWRRRSYSRLQVMAMPACSPKELSSSTSASEKRRRRVRPTASTPTGCSRTSSGTPT